jgi:hypothetical protein
MEYNLYINYIYSNYKHTRILRILMETTKNHEFGERYEPRILYVWLGREILYVHI